MGQPAAAAPIPWVYSDSPGVLMWTWLTDHFIATISGAEVIDAELAGEGAAEIVERVIRSYHWDLSDLMRTNQGIPRSLIEGTSARFDDAELFVREHVGKCYDPRLGYQPFAGCLSNTFVLTGGDAVDVTPLLGTRCTVTVLQRDGRQEVVMGDLSLLHYKWRLRNGNEMLEITPEHVVSIVNRSGAAQLAAALDDVGTNTAIGRIYAAERSRGCTGTPGFVVGTVDHAGAPKCPIHEASGT